MTQAQDGSMRDEANTAKCPLHNSNGSSMKMVTIKMGEKKFTQIQSVLTICTVISLVPGSFISPGWLQWPSNCSASDLPCPSVYSQQRNARDLVKIEGNSCYYFLKTLQAPHIQRPPSSCVVWTPVTSLTSCLSPGPPICSVKTTLPPAISQTLQPCSCLDVLLSRRHFTPQVTASSLPPSCSC